MEGDELDRPGQDLPVRRSLLPAGCGLHVAGRFIRHAFPWLRHIFADGAYTGPKLAAALKWIGRWTLEIVQRPAGARVFDILARRWVVERTLAWLNRNRQLAKDFEASVATGQAWLFIASVQLLTRRLARY